MVDYQDFKEHVVIIFRDILELYNFNNDLVIRHIATLVNRHCIIEINYQRFVGAEIRISEPNSNFYINPLAWEAFVNQSQNRIPFQIDWSFDTERDRIKSFLLLNKITLVLYAKKLLEGDFSKKELYRKK